MSRVVVLCISIDAPTNSPVYKIAIVVFLYRMFETRADVMAMFEQFRSVDKADLGSSRALENHALLVMNALDEAIANMDDPEYLIDLLLSTGKSHRRFDNFSTIIFWVSKVYQRSQLFGLRLDLFPGIRVDACMHYSLVYIASMLEDLSHDLYNGYVN
jgi:hypothetical protein